MFLRILFLLSLLLPTFFVFAKELDSDGDRLSDKSELEIYFTNPNNSDTDFDGYKDNLEIINGYSPLYGEKKKLIQVDSDKDYLNDAWELILGTGLMNPDSDGDLYLDGTEVAASYDPINSEHKIIKKKIDINLEEQNLKYYFGGKLLDSFLISSGLVYTPTPEGQFQIFDKYPLKHYGGINFDYPNTKWNLHFATKKYRYYIHGAYWHNNFGFPMSHGCVNVPYEKMEPLYWFSQIGTEVNIF